MDPSWLLPALMYSDINSTLSTSIQSNIKTLLWGKINKKIPLFMGTSHHICSLANCPTLSLPFHSAKVSINLQLKIGVFLLEPSFNYHCKIFFVSSILFDGQKGYKTNSDLFCILRCLLRAWVMACM